MLASLIGLLRSEYKPGAGEFSNIDARRVAGKLGLEKHGAARGRADQPDTEAKQLDAVELGIVGDIRTYAGDAYTRTNNHVKTYVQRLKSHDISGATAAFKTTASKVEGDFDAEILAARSELERAHEGVASRAAALEQFQKTNGIGRPADPPKNHRIYVSILIMLFVVEVVPNSIFLGEGSDFGVVGGVVKALFYSVLNLGIAFFTGLYGWTNLQHRKFWRKLVGLIGTLGTFAAIAGLNLGLAHYRFAALNMPDALAVREALRLVWETPLAIGDLTSAVMVGLGLLFAFIVMLEGYYWQDPYPGYAKVDRHHREAQDVLEGVILEKIREIKETQEKAIDEMRVERARLRDRRNALPTILEERKRLIDSFASHIAQPSRT